MSELLDNSPAKQDGTTSKIKSHPEKKETIVKEEHDNGCDWGQSRLSHQYLASNETDSSKFSEIYEDYLENKKSFLASKTDNYSSYCNNPQKVIRDFFKDKDHEFKLKIRELSDNQFICSLDLPIDDLDFAVASEIHAKKQSAIDEMCLIACKLLDESQLLYSWQQLGACNSNFGGNDLIRKKRQIDEANREDDIEIDDCRKRHCEQLTKAKAQPKVNTYESLMEQWKELNMSILMLKASLVKLDLSVTQKDNDKARDKVEQDDEDDPLNAFMSDLDMKTELSMNDKIEKTRLKNEILSLETKQKEVSKLIELAKPKFDLSKVDQNRSKI